MAFAWQTGVLEHHPGMPKETYAAMSATDLLSNFIMCVQKVCTLIRCLGRGRYCHETYLELVLIRVTLQLSSRDMAYDLLHSHRSAGQEGLTFIIVPYVLTRVLATASGD